MLRIVHDNQMQHPTFLQIARRLLQKVVVQPCAHPEKEMEIRCRAHFLPAIHAVDGAHTYLRLFHIRCTAACEHTHAQDVGVDCNLHIVPLLILSPAGCADNLKHALRRELLQGVISCVHAAGELRRNTDARDGALRI